MALMSTLPALAVTSPLPTATSATVTDSSSSSLTDWALLVLPGLIWGASFLPRSLLAVLALGCLGTAAANAIMAVAAGRLGPARASATTFLIPVVALLLGLLVRGEQVAAIAVGGCVLCLTGAGLMRRDTLPRQRRGSIVGLTGVWK